MIEKLSLIDRKLLAELETNCRIPDSRLAKRLRISRDRVSYRIDKLVEKGIITKFTVFIDPWKFGFTMWKVYIKFQHLPKAREREMIEFLKNRKAVWWIVKCVGRYDMIFSIVARNVLEFFNEYMKFKSLFSEYELEVQITNHIEPEDNVRGYLLNKPSCTLIPSMRNDQKADIDKTDLEILKILVEDSRMSSIEIARRLNITARQVAYRIKRLKKDDIIVVFRAALNVNKIGYDYYKVFISLHNTTEEKQKSLINYCRRHPNIVNLGKTVGPWEFELEFETRDYKELNRFMRQIQEKFPTRPYHMSRL